MSETEVAYAEPPEKESAAVREVDEPQFVVGTENASNTAPALPEFIVDPAAQREFNEQQLAELLALDADTLQTALTEFSENRIDTVSSADAAVLLLTTHNRSDISLTPEAAAVLQAKVQEDPLAAEYYWTERYKILDPKELAAAIIELAQKGDLLPAVPGSQLLKAQEQLVQQGAELATLAENNPELETAMDKLNTEVARREDVVVDLSQQTAAIETDGDPVAAELQAGGTIKEYRRDGDAIAVTVEQPDGTTKVVRAKEEDIGTMWLLMAASDFFLGTNTLQEVGQQLITKNFIFPVLHKMGVDTSVFRNQFGSEKWNAMNGMFKTMDNHSCQRFFERAVDEKYIFDMLLMVMPDHRDKIFNPAGTKPFGSTSLLGFDHLRLDQELVNKMYAALTERQREELKIPKAQEQATA